MTVKLLTEHLLEFVSLKGGCTGSSESTHAKCHIVEKLHIVAHLYVHLLCRMCCSRDVLSLNSLMHPFQQTNCCCSLIVFCDISENIIKEIITLKAQQKTASEKKLSHSGLISV